MGAATIENSMEVPQKIKNRNTILSSNSISRYLSKGYETLAQKNICTSTFTAALFIIGKTWKQCKCPLMDEWIKKMWFYVIYIVDSWTTLGLGLLTLHVAKNLSISLQLALPICSSVYTDFTNSGLFCNILHISWKISTCKLTLAVQACVVQRSIVYIYSKSSI